MKKLIILGMLLAALGILATACAGGAAKVPAGERTFYVNAIEIKGATSTKTLATPSKNPEELSQGYAHKAPGVFYKADPTRWEVSSYQFNPSAMTVFQGDRVKLILFVVNGDKHKDSIMDPDGVTVVAEKEHNRGRQYEITFTADKAGFYALHCEEHKETMHATITVVPR
ncbi:MAG: cupredoxin domain-containing protein [Chloroflexi bacterium]|nr:cupredoxin domain-containing protein [Chloroflexota bacterium]